MKFYSNLHDLNHEWMCEFGLNSLSRRRRPGVFRKQTNYIILFLGEFLTGLQESFDYCFGHYAAHSRPLKYSRNTGQQGCHFWALAPEITTACYQSQLIFWCNTPPRRYDLNGGESLPTCCSPAMCCLRLIPLLFLLLLVKLSLQIEYLTNG